MRGPQSGQGVAGLNSRSPDGRAVSSGLLSPCSTNKKKWRSKGHQYGVKRIDPWLVLIGPGAGRRKEAVKRDEEAGGRGWREMAGVRGEEVVVRRAEEERDEEGGSAMVEAREEDGGAKGVERKEGEREGFTSSF